MPGTIFCRKCGYDLRAQVAPFRCPECGRDFDPADRKTFLGCPPRGPAWRWAKRAVILLLSLAMCWGWLYWGWRGEQVAMAKMKVFHHEAEPVGGRQLKHYLGSAGWVLDRATYVHLIWDTTDTDMIYLKELTRLRWLQLSCRKVSNTGLLRLKELKGLRRLDLDNTDLTAESIAELRVALPGTKILEP